MADSPAPEQLSLDTEARAACSCEYVDLRGIWPGLDEVRRMTTDPACPIHG